MCVCVCVFSFAPSSHHVHRFPLTTAERASCTPHSAAHHTHTLQIWLAAVQRWSWDGAALWSEHAGMGPTGGVLLPRCCHRVWRSARGHHHRGSEVCRCLHLTRITRARPGVNDDYMFCTKSCSRCWPYGFLVNLPVMQHVLKSKCLTKTLPHAHMPSSLFVCAHPAPTQVTMFVSHARSLRERNSHVTALLSFKNRSWNEEHMPRSRRCGRSLISSSALSMTLGTITSKVRCNRHENLFLDKWTFPQVERCA